MLVSIINLGRLSEAYFRLTSPPPSQQTFNVRQEPPPSSVGAHEQGGARGRVGASVYLVLAGAEWTEGICGVGQMYMQGAFLICGGGG